jgi:hypothetical protein
VTGFVSDRGFVEVDPVGADVAHDATPDHLRKAVEGSLKRLRLDRIDVYQLHIPEYEGRENVAEKWSKKFSGKFVRDRYWCLLPLAAPILLIKGLGGDFRKLFRRFRAKS